MKNIILTKPLGHPKPSNYPKANLTTRADRVREQYSVTVSYSSPLVRVKPSGIIIISERPTSRESEGYQIFIIVAFKTKHTRTIQ